MFKRILFLFIFFILTSQLAYNQNLTGKIYSKQNSKAINNVKITDITNNKIYYTKYDGSFDISFNGRRKIVLKVEHINYVEQTLHFDYGQRNLQIFLELKTTNITPVVVSVNNISRQQNKYSVIEFNTGAELFNNSTNSSIDDFLKYSSEVNIIKPSGIYTNSPIITTQGMSDVPGRTLVLYDGIILNKSDDGNVNWNMFPPSVIKKIQVSNTSNSITLGNSSLGGTINFVPSNYYKQGFHGFIKGHSGQFNTYGSELELTQYHKGLSGFFFTLNAFGQMSDGYISTPDSLQYADVEYIPTNLKEIKTHFVMGYNIKGTHTIKLIANVFDDFRGLGEKIQEENGSYTKHTSQFTALKYDGNIKFANYGVIVSFQNENYFKNIESIKNNAYSLIYVNSLRRDLTGSLYSTIDIFDLSTKYKTALDVGCNYNFGEVYGQDEYQTSSDLVINSGQMINLNMYSKFNFIFFSGKLNFGFGLDYSLNKVKSPSFLIENPTGATDFMLNYTGNFDDHSFVDTLLLFFANYKILDRLQVYGMSKYGNSSPGLEDLTRSGLNRYGFKLANPNLISEKMWSYNLGIAYIGNNLSVKTEAYYKTGDDFIYYLETGDAIFGGRKKIIQKQNVTNVTIYGGNLGINFNYKKIGLFANYTYNYSYINKFDSIPDLENKMLTYSPIHSAHAGVRAEINMVNLTLSGSYFSNQYTDNFNTEKIDGYYTFDFSANAEILKNLYFDFSLQNFLDYQYLIFYDQLSIGRFMTFSLKYKW